MKTFMTGLILGLVLGVAGTMHFYKPVMTTEAAAPAAVQSDGSLIVQRAPDALKPKQIVPAGSKAVRVERVVIQAKPIVKDGRCGCDPATLDLTLVKQHDGTQRAIVSSDDGKITSALDSPLAPDLVQQSHPWAVGATYGTGGRAGAFVDRDVGPLRVGLEADQAYGADWQARVRAGWRF